VRWRGGANGPICIGLQRHDEGVAERVTAGGVHDTHLVRRGIGARIARLDVFQLTRRWWELLCGLPCGHGLLLLVQHLELPQQHGPQLGWLQARLELLVDEGLRAAVGV
jgi:hypothetical protein